MSLKDAIQDIRFEIDEIENQIGSFEQLLKICLIRKPDIIETAALGSLLHGFYTGIEKIFALILKHIDKKTLTETAWHKELLISMNKENEYRKRLITNDTFLILAEYLNFRHFFRYSYDYHLDWDKMKGMVLSLNSNWIKVKKEIIQLIESI